MLKIIIENINLKKGKVADPIVTGWRSWPNAALYHSLNFNKFFKLLILLNIIIVFICQYADVKNELMDIDKKYFP